MEGHWLRNPRNGIAVVFVHGVLSSGESCWRNANGTYWPELLISESDIQSVGIYVFTYQTGIFSGTYSLGDVVSALQEHLRLDKVLDVNQIVFVCHSMGGIVVRKYLVSRTLDLIDREIAVGLFLIASPSLGSKYANFFAILARIMKHTQLDVLRFTQSNTWLNDLDTEFLNLKESDRLRILGREIVEDKFIVFPRLFTTQVVPPFSGARFFAEPNKVPGSDHFSIAKPENARCIQHRMLVDFIEACLPQTISHRRETSYDTQPLGHHFVCYSTVDGKASAFWLARELERAPNNLRCWLAERDLGEVEDILGAVDDTLRRCASLIFVLTTSSARADDRCIAEWKRAISYNKPITIIRCQGAPPSPLALDTRKSFDISDDPSATLSLLANRLSNMPLPSGQLETLREQLAANERALEYAPANSKARLQFESDAIEKQIAAIANALQDEDALRNRVMTAVERERRTAAEIEARPTASVRFVNAPPLAVPSYFENRVEETGLVIDFLRDPAASILVVHGRGGVGKTALVCRVLRELERDQLPDNAGGFRVAAVIYINCTRAGVDLFEEVLAGIRVTLSPEIQEDLRPILESPQSNVATILRSLLSRLPSNSTVVLLDNFEDILSPEKGRISNAEIYDLLSSLMEVSEHPLKMVITTREVPQYFWEASPSRLKTISMAEGLRSPYAERVLRRLDADGSAGLKDASDAKLKDAVAACRGFPRALEALYSRMKGDPTADLDELVSDLLLAHHAESKITWVLVGEAFSRLLPIDQRVMQAVATFGRPVSDTGVQYILADWAPYIDGHAVLQRLVALHFIRREGRSYYVHPIDRQYALDFLTRDERIHLHSLAANYYQEIERPRRDWVSLQDAKFHLEQFRLRLDAQDYDSAASILEELATFLDKRGAFELKLSLGESLMKGRTEKRIEALALEHVASAQWRIGRLRLAVSAQEQLVKLLSSHPSEGDLLREEGNLLIYRARLGATNELLVEFRAYLARFEASRPGNKEDISTLLNHVADCYENLGYLNEALHCQQRSTDLASKSSDPDHREAQLHNLGTTYHERGEVTRAEELYNEALALNKESKNPLWKANHLGALSSCSNCRGHFTQAIVQIDTALQIRQEIGDLEGNASDTAAKAAIFLTKGDIQLAKRAALAAYELAVDLRLPLRRYRRVCADALLSEGKVEEAAAFIAEPDDENSEGKWDFENSVGAIRLRQGLEDDARYAFDRARTQCELWLSRSTENLAATAGNALAYAGLAIIGIGDAERHAKQAYRRALEFEVGAGLIAEWRRRLEQIRTGEGSIIVDKILSESFPA
jgi:tetratricopeptide (TPR) repeat protein